jgi:hypothetical protein
MTTVTTEVLITPDRRVNLALDLPPDCPLGAATVTVTFQPKLSPGRAANLASEIYGQGRGQVWMAEDFDAPLEGFAEYS